MQDVRGNNIALEARFEGEGLEEEGGGDSSWQGPYLKSDKLPKDPWGSAYRYEFPGKNNSVGEPDIWSVGPDRKDNTEEFKKESRALLSTNYQRDCDPCRSKEVDVDL